MLQHPVTMHPGRFQPPPRPILPTEPPRAAFALLVGALLALSACTSSTASEPEALPLGEVRGGEGMAEHNPSTLLRALLLPLGGDELTCTADDSINPRWARCGRYELAYCTGRYACDVLVDDVAIGSLQSRVNGDTWSFSAHWSGQLVQGVRDGQGAVVVVTAGGAS